MDPSAQMLATCQKCNPSFVLRTGTFVEIPFEASGFDAVVSSFAFHEVFPEQRSVACAELKRIVRSGAVICLLDIMFASALSRKAAKRALGSAWDDEEDYPLVGEMDQLVREAGFVGTLWRQTAPCHWVLVARRST